MAFHNTFPTTTALLASSQPSSSKSPSSTLSNKLDKVKVQDELEVVNSAKTSVPLIFSCEDCIALDENFTNFSAAPILPTVPFNLQGKDVSQVSVYGKNASQARSTSLPSSPSKYRDIAELRDEINRMKKLAYGKEHEDPKQSKKDQDEVKEDTASHKGQSSAPSLPPQPIAESSPPNFSISSPLRKVHAKLDSLSKHSQNPHYQVHSPPSVEFKIQNKTFPPPPPGKQQPSLTKTKPMGLNQNPKVNNQASSPLVQFENPIISPAHIVDHFNSNFPPLLESTKPYHSVTQPPSEPSYNPTNSSQKPPESSHNPTTPNPPWTHLFNSNRVKANGTSLEYIPNFIEGEGGKPAVTIIVDEVSEEICRWRNAIVGYVIGARPPFKLMKRFVERRWKAFGHIELFVLKPGIFIFRFQNEETKQRVLDMGPWS